MKTVIKIAIVLTLMALSACQSVQTTQGGVVGVDRKQMMMVSREQVEQDSAKAYQSLLSDSKAKGALDRDPNAYARVQAIAKRLIAQVGVFRPDAMGWRWESNVLTSDEVNAFCMAGGKIAVYTALINKLAITDDELAAVMGHEISHALREHVREQMTEQQFLNLGAVAVGLYTGNQAVMDMSHQLLQVGIGLRHSRRAEVEADEMGLELAARAGYDPRAAISLWQKMDKLGGGRPPEYLSTHPAPETRIADLTRVSALVMPLYQKAAKI